METGWIQIFILTIAECVAPSGKSVCQESQFELQFLQQADCEVALQQLVSLKKESDNVIVDEQRSGCAPSARQGEVFSSVAAAEAALSDQDGWRAPPTAGTEPTNSMASHEERLNKLKSCDETDGHGPCKVGDIIIEGEAQQVEVWRRDQ
jgi:hypothetical protein